MNHNYTEINEQAAKLYGEPVQEADEATKDEEAKHRNPNKLSKKIFKTIWFKAAICLIIAFIVITVGYKIIVPGYEEPIRQSIQLINKREAGIAEYYKYKNPFKVYDSYTKDEYTDDSSDMQTNKFFQEQIDFLERAVGEDFKVSYDIVLTERLEKEYFESYQTIAMDNPDLEITKGYKVYVAIILSGSEQKHAFMYETIVMKINGKWCLNYMLTPTSIYSGLPLY